MPRTASLRLFPDLIARTVAHDKFQSCVILRGPDGAPSYHIVTGGRSHTVSREAFRRAARAVRRDALAARFRAT